MTNLEELYYALRCGRYAADILVALADMERGDYTGAREMLEIAARGIRNEIARERAANEPGC